MTSPVCTPTTGPTVYHPRGGAPFAGCDAGCIHMDDAIRHTETCETVQAWRAELARQQKEEEVK